MEQSWSLPSTDTSLSEMPTDDELIALALAADPESPVDLNAEPYHFGLGFNRNALPQWYMPSPMASGRGRGTKVVIVSVVIGMMVIAAFGLCITSGFLQFA
ncbi:MAG TPA: hypothetical protein VND89_08095 [Acidimicrobiales bacterium]|nr:hypothetical protein [Acidimicrobiales bacterium]